MNNVGIIGSGFWGTAIAIQLAKKTKIVTLYTRSKSEAEKINNTHINDSCFPNITLANNIVANSDIKNINKENIVVIAVPCSVFANIVKSIALYISKDTVIVIATKGLSIEDGSLLHELVEKSLKTLNVAVIAGPNFAIEFAQNLMTSIVVASKNLTLAKSLTEIFTTDTITAFSSDDLITVQVSSAMKNVIAIASGIIKGLDYGDNAQAFLISKAIEEIVIVSQKLGAISVGPMQSEIMGDLILTTTSMQSRNMRFGYNLAKSNNPEKFLSEQTNLIEGLNAIPLIRKIANYHSLKLPISEGIIKIIQNPEDLISCIKHMFQAIRSKSLNIH